MRGDGRRGKKRTERESKRVDGTKGEDDREKGIRGGKPRGDVGRGEEEGEGGRGRGVGREMGVAKKRRERRRRRKRIGVNFP
jgi:hypothetical protein